MTLVGLNNIFLYVSSGKENKSKDKQMELHQTKNLLLSKANYQQNKKEKIFSNDVSNKGLMSKIYNQLIKLRKTNNLV